MAAPIVTGAIALMLEANAALTPNAVKAILEFTAESREGYDHLTQGAGFLNARGAVELARAFSGAGLPPALSSDPVRWSRHIIWGNRRVAGGMLGARANAWKLGVTWGDTQTARGEAITWGIGCREGDANCDEAAWTAPCNVVTPDCDPAAPDTASMPGVEDLVVGAAADVASVVRFDRFTESTASRPRDALDSRRRPAGNAGRAA
jgi:hypothetical protein